MERRGPIIRSVWAACFLLAGLNHARILLRQGLFWDYHGADPISTVYWTSLTLVDPLVAALLFVRPGIGVPATVVVITTNVVHNLVVTARFMPYAGDLWYVTSNLQIVSQIGFLLFVVATWRMAWEDVRRVDVPPEDQPV